MPEALSFILLNTLYYSSVAKLFLAAADLFLEPILAFNEAGDDVGRNIVTCGVDHGCGRIDEVSDCKSYGEGYCKLVGEEQSAEHKLARTAAAGDTAHCDGGEYRNDYCEYCFARAEVKTEHTEQECDFDDSAHCGAVHVHSRADGYDDVGDFLGNAGLLADLHVGGDGSDG